METDTLNADMVLDEWIGVSCGNGAICSVLSRADSRSRRRQERQICMMKRMGRVRVNERLSYSVGVERGITYKNIRWSFFATGPRVYYTYHTLPRNIHLAFTCIKYVQVATTY